MGNETESAIAGTSENNKEPKVKCDFFEPANGRKIMEEEPAIKQEPLNRDENAVSYTTRWI